ncbi:histidine kinase [Bifidobacterium longum]|uniref:histidine kinase n=1 Tax=Bifidobacterium longum TaxID=216816 RepID=UPI001F3C56B3|nr:histidine kinase [Bifidobacterium longum]UIP48753.1 histidine kinase [Bifidobacterium longum]
MIIMCLCPLSLGFSLNLLFAQRQATATLRQRLDREHTARHLHDTISNDLAYMILRIDQASRSDCPADREQYQRQLTDLRAIAETALDHTHQVIRQLERTDKPDDRSRIVKTNNDDKTDRKIEHSVNGLTASFNRNDVALAASDSKVTTSSGRSTIHWRTTSSTFSKDCSTNCTRTSPSTPPRTNGTPSRSPSTGGTSSFRQATY